MVSKSLHRSIDIANLIHKTIVTNQLIQGTDRVLLSISGGQDSICFLSLLNQFHGQFNLHLGLFWCHHLWQIDSFSLMRQIAKISFLFQFNSCFAITEKFVPSELLARNWRHKCSYRICLFYNYYKMGLAHSANDKVETILLNLMRGTGVTGLSPLQLRSTKAIQRDEHISTFLAFPTFFFSWYPRWFDVFFCVTDLIKPAVDNSKQKITIGIFIHKKGNENTLATGWREIKLINLDLVETPFTTLTPKRSNHFHVQKARHTKLPFLIHNFPKSFGSLQQIYLATLSVLSNPSMESKPYGITSIPRMHLVPIFPLSILKKSISQNLEKVFFKKQRLNNSIVAKKLKENKKLSAYAGRSLSRRALTPSTSHSMLSFASPQGACEA